MDLRNQLSQRGTVSRSSCSAAFRKGCKQSLQGVLRLKQTTFSSGQRVADCRFSAACLRQLVCNPAEASACQLSAAAGPGSAALAGLPFQRMACSCSQRATSLHCVLIQPGADQSCVGESVLQNRPVSRIRVADEAGAGYPAHDWTLVSSDRSDVLQGDSAQLSPFLASIAVRHELAATQAAGGLLLLTCMHCSSYAVGCVAAAQLQ